MERHKEVKAAVEEVQRAVETKLSAQEARFNALLPDKLPIARTYCPDTVHYAGEVVVHRGATYQALRDTARAPPHVNDWICLASAGRDAVTPNVCGTYNAHEKYRQLDVVAMDRGAFIARKDNPGICPGPDWQLMCKQGKTGQPGIPGERGPRGERGEKGPAVMPQLVSSKIDENYNLVILRSDDSLEIIPLREAFERYHVEAGG
jgi:hypothetical protein